MPRFALKFAVLILAATIVPSALAIPAGHESALVFDKLIPALLIAGDYISSSLVMPSPTTIVTSDACPSATDCVSSAFTSVPASISSVSIDPSGVMSVYTSVPVSASESVVTSIVSSVDVDPSSVPVSASGSILTSMFTSDPVSASGSAVTSVYTSIPVSGSGSVVTSCSITTSVYSSVPPSVSPSIVTTTVTVSGTAVTSISSESASSVSDGVPSSITTNIPVAGRIINRAAQWFGMHVYGTEARAHGIAMEHGRIE
ncbi:uncharacterized protein B0H18DRAFT_984150 [Fomitopsis serialis]|uniref:uncharacterized protein n=1 Tax=Fomitopsis serialis TaxID=139415 RepID=UPI0020081A2E|nr:uncharacterized protein B0H18DRAFT_984150 [Neoantrodia serialis]KAH9933514.1 hypothetical protein B0H18DRAFT_984150 [Neoantrodia serialis]